MSAQTETESTEARIGRARDPRSVRAGTQQSLSCPSGPAEDAPAGLRSLMARKYRFDPKCLELAEYFLADATGAVPTERAWELAQILQDAMEAFDPQSDDQKLQEQSP